jgi:hypothetical protein
VTSLRLAVEALALYVGLPLLFDRLLVSANRRLLFPALWVLALIALAVLYADPTFNPSTLWSLWIDPAYARLLVGRTAVGVAILALLSRRFAPTAFLVLPRTRPLLWVLIAIFYPILSVLPQGVIWRVFFVHRYEPLFGRGAALLLAGAVAFAFAHIIFRNVLALALTGLGGVLFLRTYLVTGSMLAASLEHAAYGVAVFTFGLGRSLYLGTARDAPGERTRERERPK